MTRIFASEEEFLRVVDRHFPRRHRRVVLARGDDAAVIVCPSRLAVSTDLFLEGSHFRTSYFSPGDVGHKALAVNLSDLAAMGAQPHGFTLGVMAPPAPHPAAYAGYWDELLSAMAALAARWDVPLVGGDLNRCATFGLAVTVWGEPGARVGAAQNRIMERGACEPGDALYVVGALGLARCGLHLLETRGRAAAERAPEAVAAHLRPEPLVDAGLALAGAGARCVMDVSDGLARDLPRLVGPERGVDLDVSALVDPHCARGCEAAGLDALATAVLGGEDYALAGAAPAAALAALRDAVPGLRRIGTVTDAGGVRLGGRLLEDSGFDHFGNAS